MDDLIIWGSGSQAMLYAAMAQVSGYNCIVVDPRCENRPDWTEGLTFLGRDDDLSELLSIGTGFIVAIGGEHGGPRLSISLALQQVGLRPISLIDSSANLKCIRPLDRGTYIAQNVVANLGVTIGRDVILNTGCTIDHECQIGDGVHIMGAAAIAGRVKIQDFVVIGTNATILPDLTIGRGAYIGAGAVVLKDVEAGAVIVGAPGRRIKTREIMGDDASVNLIESLLT